MTANPTFDDFLRGMYSAAPNQLETAELYTLMSGGKRIRPELLFTVLKGHDFLPEFGYPAAAAIELIHNYSLIHDDLPAMDNDSLRRGKPSSHIKFGEALAILAGDAMLTKAFEVLARQTCQYSQQLLYEYALAAGDQGMAYGQVLDLEMEKQTAVSTAKLEAIDMNKTGKLLALPLIAGAYLTDDLEALAPLRKIGGLIGIAFQIQDDLLDFKKNPLGCGSSDLERGKATYLSLLGHDRCVEVMNEHFTAALKECKYLEYNVEPLKKLIKSIRDREV